MQQQYDAVGRLCAIAPTATDCAPANYYAKGFAYNPAQQVTGFNFGNGVSATFGYSPDRLQMTSLAYTKAPQTLFSLNYWYKQDPTNCLGGTTGNNGQVQCITDSVDSGRTANYTYDALYRLKTAGTTGSAGFPTWGLSETYDRFGNRWTQAVTAGSGPASSLTFGPGPDTSTTNEPNGHTYDPSGNLLVQPGSPTTNYTYDAENRATSVANGTSSGTYTYDGNGLRVKRVAAGGVTANTVYIFSGSQVIAEYDNGALPASPTREYIYAGAQRVAKIEAGSAVYLHNDHLSVRAISDATGAKIGELGHYPYGETWYETGTTTKMKFTTYERDAESTSDYAMARYYGNQLGRFYSPDLLGGSLTNPQSLNRYTYALNDPCSLTDPLGLAPCTFHIALDDRTNLSQDERQAALTKLNDILKANDPNLAATFDFKGKTDFTAKLVNANSGPLGLWYVQGPDTYGRNGATGTGGLLGQANNAEVYRNKIARVTVFANVGVGIGQVIAHEFGHFAYNMQDDRSSPKNRDLGIMSPGSPYLTEKGFDFFPSTLQAKCAKFRALDSGSGDGGGGGVWWGFSDRNQLRFFQPTIPGSETGGIGRWVWWPVFRPPIMHIL